MTVGRMKRRRTRPQARAICRRKYGKHRRGGEMR